jgi:hypothetical protein
VIIVLPPKQEASTGDARLKDNAKQASWYPAIPVQAPAVVKRAIQVTAIAADNARATLHHSHVIQTDALFLAVAKNDVFAENPEFAHGDNIPR